MKTPAIPPDDSQVTRHPNSFALSLPSTVPEEADEPATRIFAASPPPTVPLPAHLGRYRIDRLLSQSSTATVYLAHDPTADRAIALKVPRFGPAKSALATPRFLQSARAAAAVLHPQLVPILEMGEIDGTPYLTMPYLEGQTLAQRLRAARLPVTEAVRLFARLAEGLDMAHQKGVLHRNLSPDHILLTPDGDPVLLGFGLARQETSAHLTQDGQVLGTPAYLAPERLTGQVGHDTAACDIFSMGVLLYESLTVQLPFGRTIREVTHRLLTQEPTLPSQVQPEVPVTLDTVCRRALARNPADRYPSMAEFARDLQGIPAATKPSFSPHEKRRLSGVGIAVLIVSLLCSTVWWFWPPPPEPSEQPRPQPVDSPIVEKKPVVMADLREIHGASVEKMRAWIEQLPAEGFEPIHIDFQSGSEEPRGNILATRVAKPRPFQLLGLMDGKTGNALEKNTPAGFRIYSTWNFRMNGQEQRVYFLAPPIGSYAWWRFGLNEIKTKITQGRASGLYPAHLSFNDEPFRVMTTLRPAKGRDWTVDYALLPEDLDAILMDRKQGGFRPSLLEGYLTGNTLRFALVCISNTEKQEWSVQVGLTPDEYERQLPAQYQSGFRPVCVTGYGLLLNTRYGVIWSAEKQ